MATHAGGGRSKAKEVHREQKRGLLRMEFKRFVNTILLMPCQIVRGGRRVLYRLLS